MTPESAEAWDGGSRGYTGYGPEGGYPGPDQPGQPAYGAQDGQYGSPYGGQPYEQYDGYGPEPHQGGPGGYGGPSGYGQQDGYGYDPGPAPSAGYGQAGYDQPAAPGYGPGGGGYRGPGGGYGQPPGYPALPAGTGGYPAPRGGSGGYPALPSGQDDYLADAGNDWYGGQPAAASGASFADTGSYRFNGRAIDEYGTGPRGTLGEQVRGYPSGPGQQGTGQLPVPVHPAAPGPQGFARTGSQSVAETRQQERYDPPAEYPEPGYPEYGQDEPGTQVRPGADNGFQDPRGFNDFDARGGYAAPDGYAEPGYGDYDGPQSPPGDRGRDGYHDYAQAFNDETDSDPYQDRYGDAPGPQAAEGAGQGQGRAPGGRAAAPGPLRGKRLLFAALAVVVVGIIGAAVYVFVLSPSSPSNTASATGPLPTGSAPPPSQQACAKTLGVYCHIETAADDPTPLTTAELFPPAFTNEKDKTSYSLVSTKVDKTCKNAVIGSALIKELQTGKCTQVVRASYVTGGNKIMGTIGVVNLTSTNEAHHAGKVVGQNDFIAPLTSAKGVASKLGNGTGVVEAVFKGHYLILTWSEFVNGTDPTTKAEDNQLEQFSNDLIAGTANIDLSQRMVTGTAPTPAASAK